MKPSSDPPAAPAPLVIESSVVEGLPAEGALLLRMSGSLDAAGAEAWSAELRGHLEEADRAGLRPVLDMAHVQLGGAAVLHTLSETTRSRTGRPDLIIVRARPGVREAVHLARLNGVRLYATLDEALRELARAASRVEDLPAWRSQMADPLRPSYEDLRKEVRALRARVRTAPVIGMAQGVLMVRYGLPDSGSAFRVLREASQRFNVPLRVLVSAVVVARPPDGEAWFPGRCSLPVPQLRILARDGRDPRCRRQMIDAVLHEALAIGRAPAGYVRFVDPAANTLMVETHYGCVDALVDHLVRGWDAGTADAVARLRGRRVSVPDVAADALLSEEFRRVLLTTGTGALYSVPVLSSSGSCTGVLTLHWADAGHRPSATQTEALGLLAADTAAWLSWYNRSVLLDALEHLHRVASGSALSPAASTASAASAEDGAGDPRRPGNPEHARTTHQPEGVRRMSNPQQPELRRSDKEGATSQDSGELEGRRTAERNAGARPHGSDQGEKGGGVPPAQRPDHP
ncbi:ANTAR domain-containing protein [Streptomyces durhamensis]|uniref:ANTAR domain-containing protein n=1 Tax=Streptomyces durhamensis TaxID=68194 RepID=UPI000B30888D|nr:ANTAR domain-containing protein [Streptomyces durhamensis]